MHLVLNDENDLWRVVRVTETREYDTVEHGLDVVTACAIATTLNTTTR